MSGTIIEVCPAIAESGSLENFFSYLYMPASLLFIFCIVGLSKQETARSGNIYGVLGISITLVAQIAQLTYGEPDYSPLFLGLGILPWAIIGVVMAIMVAMTGMPQMVGILNSFGGLAAALASFAFYDNSGHGIDVLTRIGELFIADDYELQFIRFTIYWGVFIGFWVFFGSVLACLKINETISGKPRQLPFGHLWNAFFLIGAVGCNIYYQMQDGRDGFFLLCISVALGTAFGLHLVAGIGGADMPVVISMLNSFSGWSGCIAGFTVQSNLLIIAGALVGASGAILSYIMCVAMNRSFMNVMLGGFGGGVTKKKAKADDGVVKETVPILVDETVKLLLDARSVVIVPGYGMATSQSQHTISAITNFLRSRNINVRFGIHPVAGRLPGHMNVLLAEAKVPYDIVLEMDTINPDLKETDVVLVIGANDIVNPAAIEDPTCDIGGMPILHVWEARTCICMKRSNRPGYSGVLNPLYYKPCTRMLYGDAKNTSNQILDELKKHVVAQTANRKERIQASLELGNESKDGEVAIELSTLVSRKEQAAQKAEQLLKELNEMPVFKKIGIPTEILAGEKRVAVTPDTAVRLRKQGFDVYIQSGAGEKATYNNEAYIAKAVHVVDDVKALYDSVEIIIKICAPQEMEDGTHEIDLMHEGQIVLSLMSPYTNADLIERCIAKKVTAMAMDAVPRISRAQKCDVLSSQALVAGYRAVLEAGIEYGSFFTQQITAAGKANPAKVLIIGAGVAGLAAIGVARAMGAIVRCFDVRAVCKDQVESLGAEFLEVDMKEDGAGAGGYAKAMSPEFIAAEMALFHEQCEEVDIVITTAAIPGRKAPILIEEKMVLDMKPGSVIVDMAAATGGNCEGCVTGEKVVTDNGVIIIGYTDMPSRMAAVSSQFFGSNFCHLFDDMGKGEKFNIDVDDDEIGPMIVTLNGDKRWPPPKPAPVPEKKAAKVEDVDVEVDAAPKAPLMPPAVKNFITIVVLLGLLGGLGFIAPNKYHQFLQVFVIACILGYFLIWNVAPALHTPLMSVTNAISGTVILSGIVQIGGSLTNVTSILAFLATGVAAVNVFGGYMVTQRMLNMFVRG